MTFDFTATLSALTTALSGTGYFTGGVQTGEPFSPPLDLTAAIFAMDWEPSDPTLNATVDVWTLCIRVYVRAGMTPEDAARVELAVLNGAAQVEAAIAGDFTLGGTVRAIDWAGGEAGHKITAKWGHLDVGGTLFRVVDWTLPLIIDDIGQFVA